MLTHALARCGILGPRPTWPFLPARRPRIDLFEDFGERDPAALFGLAARFVDQPTQGRISSERESFPVEVLVQAHQCGTGLALAQQ